MASQAAALATKSAGVGLQIGSIFGQAAIDRVDIENQIFSINLQQSERTFRKRDQIRAARRQAKKVASAQEEAFVSAGVKLEGTALNVLSGTMNDLLESELNKQREIAFEEEITAVREATLRSKKDQLGKKALVQSAGVLLGAAGSSIPQR